MCEPWSDAAACPHIGPCLQGLVACRVRGETKQMAVARARSRREQPELLTYKTWCGAEASIQGCGLCSIDCSVQTVGLVIVERVGKIVMRPCREQLEMAALKGLL